MIKLTNTEIITDLKHIGEYVEDNVPNLHGRHYIMSLLGGVIASLGQPPANEQGVDATMWLTCKDCTLYTEICENMNKDKLCGVFERASATCVDCTKSANEQGWVSSVELPIEGKEVLVQYRGKMEIAKYEDGQWELSTMAETHKTKFANQPEAWQPLPSIFEPYKED
jgi:hypothetical protein